MINQKLFLLLRYSYFIIHVLRFALIMPLIFVLTSFLQFFLIYHIIKYCFLVINFIFVGLFTLNLLFLPFKLTNYCLL